MDLLLQEDTIAALAESGAETVWVGAESGSQKILDAMDKGTTVEQIYEATRLLKKNNIRPAFFLQFGYLGEEKEDIEKTIKMVLDLMPEEIGISVSYPLPGTKFYDKRKRSVKGKS
ncbi:MAG: radical SAM protein [Ignavibacteriales bacterium]|nr:radical SAM protein [Ignavibacteriales bacterium]